MAKYTVIYREVGECTDNVWVSFLSDSALVQSWAAKLKNQISSPKVVAHRRRIMR